MRRLKVSHRTTYNYANKVRFGDHRMMFRPRDSHDLRILSTSLAITPRPERIRWLHDVFGNSVAIASFDAEATELCFESDILLQHFESEEPDAPIEEYARTYPFSYASSEIPDLARLIELQYPDPEHLVDSWTKSRVLARAPDDTWEMLGEMTRAIQHGIAYQAREVEGVQTPAETLALKSGSCRDLAVLMMESARSLGFAARFVSGYLYAPDIGGSGTVGGGATHAWAQIYLPGSGWVEFDPTNGIVGNRDLIRVAVARDPSQAVPLKGAWTGAPDDFVGIQVAVSVTVDPDDAEPDRNI